MKITYIKLKNFIGIYVGMKKKELEISFDNNKNDIIMLLGENGSGKTSLLSALTPMRGNNDEREDIILPNEEGYKEIHIVNKKDKYIIKHYYGKKNKSFINKNGEELNENGGIRTFNSILYNELGIDDDYFRIGRVGSNVTNFIDYKTADRKKYINNFIPSIEDYLEAFDIVKNKFSDITRDMKRLTDTISKYDNIENMKDDKIHIETEINAIKNTIDTTNNRIISLKTIIDNYKTFIKNEIYKIGYNESEDVMIYINRFKKEINKAKSNIELLQNELKDNYFQRYPNLANYNRNRINETILTEEKELITLNSKLENVYQNLTNTKDLINNNLSKKISYNKKLESFVIDDIDEIKEILDDKIKEMESLNNSLNNIKIDNNLIKEFDKNIFIKDNNKLINLYNNIIFIKGNYNEEHLKKALKKINKKIHLLSRISNNRNDINSYNEKILKKEQEIKNINNEISKIEGNKNLLDILNERPYDCEDDNCPFINNAVEYKNKILPTLKDKTVKKEYLESKLSEYKDKIEVLSILDSIYKDIKSMILPNIDLQISDFIEEKNLEDIEKLFFMNTNELQDLLNLNNYIQYFNMKDDYDKVKSSVDYYNNTVNSYDSVVNSYNLIKNEIKEIEDTITECNKEVIKYENQYNDYIKKKAIKERKIKILYELLEIFTKIDEYKEQFKNGNDVIYKVEDYINVIEDNEKEIKEKEIELTKMNTVYNLQNEKLKKLNSSIIILEDNINKLNNIESVYDNYKIIKEALDPKCGIPLIFIDNYLKDIAERTNELLDIAYHGQFKIKFDISSTDFFIRVLKSDGTELKDIKDASQGEVSFVNASLSLALVEKIINKYNIIYLDEIDATLSTENRRLFLQLIENQIEKLGIEQLFVISHNNEFYSYPVDLILLKDNGVDINDKEFMQNKNIIYNINKK